MSHRSSAWSEHIDNLPKAIQDHSHQMLACMGQTAQRLSTEPLADFTFLPKQDKGSGATFAATEAFDSALSQWVAKHLLSPHEIPLLYIGYPTEFHSIGARVAQGFVLTDQALYAQDDCSALEPHPSPKSYALPSDPADVSNLLAYATTRFAWADWAEFSHLEPSVLRKHVIFVLDLALQTILRYHSQHNTQLRLQAMPIPLSPFIAKHGLQTLLLLGGDPDVNRKLGKLGHKFGVAPGERIHLALVDFNWLGSPRGLALTGQAIYTGQYVGAPIRIPWSKVDPDSLRYTDDGKELRLNGKLPLFLPARITDPMRAELRFLLQQEMRSLMTQLSKFESTFWAS